jgi:hypothetical protein
MSLITSVYVVTSVEQFQEVNSILQRIHTHPFSKNLPMKLISYSDLEQKSFFAHIREDSQNHEVFEMSKQGNMAPQAMVVRGANEAAILVPPNSNPEDRTLIHELGHIQAAMKRDGLKLRTIYEEKRSTINQVLSSDSPRARSLIERIVFLPEEYLVEQGLMENLDEPEKGPYLENVYITYQRGLEMAKQNDTSGSTSLRLQAALNRFNFALASRIFAKLAITNGIGICSERFSALAKEFQGAKALSGVRFDQLWNLLEANSVKQWVLRTLNEVKQVIKKTLPDS